MNRKISKLKKKFESIKKKEADLIAQLKQEKEAVREALEQERFREIKKIVSQISSNPNEDALILGALLDLKEKVSAGNSAELDRYIEIYQRYYNPENQEEERGKGADGQPADIQSDARHNDGASDSGADEPQGHN